MKLLSQFQNLFLLKYFLQLMKAFLLDHTSFVHKEISLVSVSPPQKKNNSQLTLTDIIIVSYLTIVIVNEMYLHLSEGVSLFKDNSAVKCGIS